jgi:hypothetical protein
MWSVGRKYNHFKCSHLGHGLISTTPWKNLALRWIRILSVRPFRTKCQVLTLNEHL